MLPFLCCTVCKVIGSYICSFARSAWNLHFVANWFYALFLCDGTCKPLLTSKPSLTIALKISKTIEKPSKPMVGPSKNIQWWWSNGIKTIEKPLKSMVAWKKTLTIPSLWKIDHRCGLLPLLTRSCFKSSKLRHIPNYHFCWAISKNISLYALE